MTCAEAERIKIEWFHGITLFLESEAGISFLNNFLGEASERDDVDYKIFLMLIESAVPLEDLNWEAEQHLSNWHSRQRSSARRLFLDGRFARGDLWDQRVWEKRYNELHETAKDVAGVIQQLIDDKKAELEEDFASERQTPIVPVPEEMIELSKPSDMITLQCENDPDAMERVRRYLEEMGSDPELSPLLEAQEELVTNKERPRTIYPPPSVPPEGETESVVCIPKSDVPSIIPKKNGDDGPDISVSYTSLDED
jgi:hypothetical protein